MIGSKDIVVYDVETTGLDKSKDHIIQFAAIKYDWNTKKIIDSLNLYIKPEGNFTIPIAVYLVHGINASTLKDKPTFKEVAEQIKTFIDGCDIVTYNGCSFDNAILCEEFNRVGIDFDITKLDNYDSFYIEKKRNGNRLTETFERYYGKTMEECGLDAHNALSDVKATLSVFVKQYAQEPFEPVKIATTDNVLSYQEFKSNVPVAAKFNSNETLCFNVGKYRNLPIGFVATFDQGYLAWCCGEKSSFVPSTKELIKSYITQKTY